MGYLSNANGTRLNVTKGWYNKLVSNKFIVDNYNVNLIKTFNTYSYQFFEEKRIKTLFKRANYLTNKPKLVYADGMFNLNVIYLEFYQKLVKKYYAFMDLILKNYEEPMKFNRRFRDDLFFKKNKINLKRYFKKKSLLKYIFKKLLFKKINVNKIKNKKVKFIINSMRASYDVMITQLSNLKENFMTDLNLNNQINVEHGDTLFEMLKAFEDYEFIMNQYKHLMLARFINPALSKIFIGRREKKRNHTNNCFNYNIKTINYVDVNSQFLTHFYLKKLKKKYMLHHMHYPLLKEFKRLKFIKGLKIRTRGRFTKTQRASYKNIRFGKIPLNNFDFPINYDFKSIPLKYGVSSIKIWLANRVNFKKQGHRFVTIIGTQAKPFATFKHNK